MSEIAPPRSAPSSAADTYTAASSPTGSKCSHCFGSRWDARCGHIVGWAALACRRSALLAAECSCASASVVVSAGGDPNLILGNLVDNSVLIGDSARPLAGEVMFWRLGLAHTFVSVPDDVLGQQVDPIDPGFADSPRECVPPAICSDIKLDRIGVGGSISHALHCSRTARSCRRSAREIRRRYRRGLEPFSSSRPNAHRAGCKRVTNDERCQSPASLRPN